MRRNYRRPALAVGLVAAVAVLLALVVGGSHSPRVSVKSQKLAGDPDKSLKNRSTPGLRGQGDIVPAASQLALEELQNKAYPSSTLPFTWRKGAMQAFSAAAGRGAGGGGSWELAGPSVGTYPAILNRTNADYVASGRVTALAIAPTCAPGNCRLWVGAAGGGVWRTDDGLASTPSWTNVSGSFGTSAIGALTYDAGSHTLYAGTGEQNESADSDAGLGIFKSTDGGDHWTLLPGSPAMSQANAVSAIVVSGGTLYVGTTYGVAGMAGVGGGAQPSFVPGSGAPKPGLWKSTDGGNSFDLMFDDSAGTWGINNVAVDSHGVLYIDSVGKGIYRSSDGGSTWEQIFHAATAGNRTEFALNTVEGHTRIYIGDGGDGATTATTGVYRGDSIDTKTAASLITGGTNGGYTRVPVAPSTQSGRLTRNYCDGQCWYDNTVYSPAGSPNTVYVLGSFDYNLQPFGIDNGAAVLLSTDGGTTWSDVTRDSGDNQIHPDQHAIVTSPSNPLLFFEGSDGGVMRSDGTLTDATARCAAVAGFGSPFTDICANANKAVPTHLYNLNAGLSTLQFQNAAVNPADSTDVMGGTQDNGTWEGTAGNANWPQTIYGDGGIAQFDVGNPAFRMNEFFLQYTDVNFQSGAPDKWVVVSGPFFHSGEASAFYKPQVADPVTSGTLFVGLQSVWRTTDFGGNQADLEANCPEFTTAGDNPACGDFVPLGDPAGAGGPNSPSDLTASGPYGTDKSGGYVVAIGRGTGDTSTLWAATRRGRVFISKNADGAAGSVSFTRIDAGSGLSSKSLPTPRRFVSGIVVDPKDPNHAFVSFGGYNEATDGITPAVPGHVFDVTYDPKTGQATWTSLDNGNGPLGNLPINAMALDSKTNRLYVGTDFGVLVSVGRSGMWRPAANGLPAVAVSGLTLDSKNRVLYAATHGRSIWMLKLNSN